MKSPLDHHELIRKSPLNILNHPCFPMKPPYLPAAAVTEPHLIRQDLALELRQDLVQQHSGQYQAEGPGVAVARARPEPRRQQRETTGTVKKNMGILKKVDFHGKKAKLKLYLGVMVTFSMVTWGLW